MAARQAKLVRQAVAALVLVTAFGAGALAAGANRAPGGQASALAAPATRIVSLVPSATETLFAIGAGGRVVGVSSFDSFPAEVRTLPRVGALLDPDTERILALRPDLVILYGSQVDLQSRLERAGIRTQTYRHGGIAEVFAGLRELWALTGRAADAARIARELQSRID